MFHLVLRFSFVVFALLTCPNRAQECENVNPAILKECSDIGFQSTARFQDVGGKDYQTFIQPHVSMLNSLLGNCSTYSKFIICSRHIPQCTDGLRPKLPCRDVCQRFVADCSYLLEERSSRRLYSALCDLLPDQDARDPSFCIQPNGFSPRKFSGSEKRANPLCGNVTKPACQTAVHTLLSNVTLARVQASLAQINQSCSAKVEQFTCYAHSAPCYSSDGKAFFPCRALCNEIQAACRPPMKNPLMDCLEFPDGNSPSGLCELDTWHVQEWPRRQGQSKTTASPRCPFVRQQTCVVLPVTEPEDAKLECYCDACISNKCKTNGSCFVQLNLDDGKKTITRECLDPGVKRQTLCDSAEKAIQGIKCCEENLCNRNLDLATRRPPTEEAKETGSIKTEDVSPASNTRIDTGASRNAGKESELTGTGSAKAAGVTIGTAVGVLLTVLGVGVAGFFLYKRYKNKHAQLKLTHDKLSNLREIKGNANEGFIELHESGLSSAVREDKEDLEKNNGVHVADVEEPRKKKVRPTVTFGGTITIGEVEDEVNGGNGDFLYNESAMY